MIFAGLLIAGALRSQPEIHPLPPTAAPIGMVDTPLGDTIAGSSVYVAGWALDRSGIRNVEVRLDGHAYVARYGVPRSDVADARPGYPDSSAAGFEFIGDFSPLELVRHELSVVAINRAGNEAVLTRKNMLPEGALGQWQTLTDQRRLADGEPFYILPGVSGVGLGGAGDLDKAYNDYVSSTIKVGMRVPILYLRTTFGADRDWQFDPDWNVERRCGDHRIAEDSLSTVIQYSIQHQLPVLFTLNGGIWADAVCDAPAWDVNDHLEQDQRNCQWNEHDRVMPDDYFKHLPGGAGSPELGRSLTFNIYATSNRDYKKRNLQAAARLISAFARNHPSLFVGVNLDPDTYLNPFYAEQQWYDYNPGTLKQFRQWLQGSGPYAGKPEPGVPDLSGYRRKIPLTLGQVGALAATPFHAWGEVEPPRAFARSGAPFWQDPWVHEWEVFRRHLIKLHYDELAQWVAATGIPAERIFSSQGFVAPVEPAKPFAINLDSPTKNYDSGGMSVEGAVPRQGHLGAILYGPSATNHVRMERGHDMFATFQRMDPGWGVVEFNTATLGTPDDQPTYQMGYEALRDMFNHGARFASPMAWNGSNGIDTAKPGYVSFTAWRNTPLEAAMRDFAVSHASVPVGARFWTFGTPRLVDSDGWTVEGGTMEGGKGYIDVSATADELALLSPTSLVLRKGEADLLVLGLPQDTTPSVIAVDARASDGSWIALGGEAAEPAATTAGLAVYLTWPSALKETEQIRVRLRAPRAGRVLRLRHVALYPPAHPTVPSVARR